MMTTLVDIEDATARLASGERPYAFEISDRITMVGPACGFGADYLQYLRLQGRYAENVEEANQFAGARGATIIGIWFVKTIDKVDSTVEDRNDVEINETDR